MATSIIKSLGYTASSKVQCGTSTTIPSSATDCYVVVYVANTASAVMESRVPLNIEENITVWTGASHSFFNFTLSTARSFTVATVNWYDANRTSDSYYQLFYR